MDLPPELIALIRSFLIRHDWRTCRSHEAKLISSFNDWTKHTIDHDTNDWFYPGVYMSFPIAFSKKELDVYLNQWTLFGRWYIILLTRYNNYWFLKRKIVYKPDEAFYDFKDWYQVHFLLLHNYKHNNEKYYPKSIPT